MVSQKVILLKDFSSYCKIVSFYQNPESSMAPLLKKIVSPSYGFLPKWLLRIYLIEQAQANTLNMLLIVIAEIFNPGKKSLHVFKIEERLNQKNLSTTQIWLIVLNKDSCSSKNLGHL